MICCKRQNDDDDDDIKAIDDNQYNCDNQYNYNNYNNSPLKDDNLIDMVQKLTEENKKLKNRNIILEDKVSKTDIEWSKNIDDFVDQWFEENEEDIDIGVIDFRLFKIDIFPDYLEKYLYKKVLKILYSFLQSALKPKV